MAMSRVEHGDGEGQPPPPLEHGPLPSPFIPPPNPLLHPTLLRQFCYRHFKALEIFCALKTELRIAEVANLLKYCSNIGVKYVPHFKVHEISSNID
ncbi:hypothetical protein RB195_009495 [Necator americanus]|uniref:Uncharacterized protein n=1 Tax=Necator americanus TaxID=51031 RepID=A0ABR1CTK0_NECAM